MKKLIPHIIIITVLFFAISGPLAGQAQIRGLLKYGETGTSLTNTSGVTVYVKGTSNTATIDDTGQYLIGVSSGSPITLVASYGSYPDIEKRITPSAGYFNFMNFWFAPPFLPSDYDGNYYQLVKLGNQTWMGENLKTSHSKNGLNIPYVESNTNWAGLDYSTQGYCWFNNNLDEYSGNFGALYNWVAVYMGDLCPSGFHVATNNDWEILLSYLGTEPGRQLKQGPFNARLPGGRSEIDGSFQLRGELGAWWSYTPSSSSNAYGTYVTASSTDAYTTTNNKNYGISARCVNNTPSATITCMTPTVCQGEGNYPKIWFNANGTGTQPYTFTYTLNDNPALLTISTAPGNDWAFFSLPTTNPGIYKYSLVSVQDAYCTVNVSSSLTVTINSLPTTPTITPSGPTTFCSGGSVILTSSTGTSYLWSTGATTQSINVTTTGNYTVRITDSNGCQSESVATAVNVNPLPIVNVGGTVPAICQGGTTAALGGYFEHGTSAVWRDGGAGGSFTNNFGHTPEITTYTPAQNAPSLVTLTLHVYGGFCGFAEASKTLTVNPNPVATIGSATQIRCSKEETGAIDLDVTGGTPSFTYTWNNGATTQDLTNMAAGEYSVLITDANGCSATASTTITEPTPLNITANPINNVTCTGCKDGSIDISVSGSTPPYSYSWSGPDYYSSTVQDIGSLGSGKYVVLVTDANSCTKTGPFEVFNPLMVTSTDDNGMGSLRNAINYANSHAGTNEIVFNIPGSGPFAITPSSPLPDITRTASIDGYSQPNASLGNSILQIELDGTNAGLSSNGLKVSTNNCIIKGLIIHDFSGNGIQITSGTGDKISANSIYENGLRGIDLQKDSESSGTVTLNDDGDADTGPNNLQNFPVLSSLSFSQGSVTVSGTLNTTPVIKSYTLEFFANKVADKYDIAGEAFGEGQTYIGSTLVTTDKKGAASFTTTLQTFAKYGDIITATATDQDGNTSEFSAAMGGLQNQILASNKIPFQYKINESNLVKTNYTIPYTTIKSEIDKAFFNWTGVNTSIMTFSDIGKTTSRYASATDNTNLVSFSDDQFPFSPGVLAVSAKTLKIVPNSTEAQIIDADIVINPYYINHPTWDLGIADNASYPGFFDIQSIVTHEIGHVMGLIHSGVYNSVMWFEIGPSTDYQNYRTLKQDDKSWLSYRYPTASYNSTYGSISGNIKYGDSYDPITGKYTEPVAGAIVLAINPDGNLPVVHAYSDAAGNYLIPGLLPGNYNVYITPLDGSVYGRPLRPGNISSYIYCNTIYTDYPGEFYNASDDANDPKDATPTTITVSVGQESKNIDFVTNVDNTPPEVQSIVPENNSSDISVSSAIVITFSEPVDISTITDQSCYLETGGTIISGNYRPEEFENNPDMIQLTPPNSLAFNTNYTLHLKTGIMDLKGNPLNVDDPTTEDVIETEYKIAFTTVAADIIPPTIKGTVPKNGATGVFLYDKIMVYFSESMIENTVENSFSLTPDDGTAKIDCSTSWDDYSTFTLTPKSPLKEGNTYTLAWTNAGTDLSKNPLVPGSISFTTISTAPPTVIYLEPGGSTDIYSLESGGAFLTSNVNVMTCIVADFSEPINTSTINSTSTFILHEGNQTGTKVPGTFEFLKDNSRVIFRPSAALKYSQTYTIELTGGIADVSSIIGYLTGFTTTFTTAAKLSTPHITYLDPYAGKAGSYVTIVGNGFDPNPVNNVVKFNNISTGVQAKVTDASLTNLTVIVPSGVISGPVTVTVNGTPDDQAPSNYVTYFYLVPPSDPAEAAATANVSTGNQSRDGVMDFNGARAFITNPGDNTVTVIENLDSDNPSSTNVSPIQVGTTPMKIAINPEGTLIYVTNYNSDNVSVIDITNSSTLYNVIRTINVGSHPLGIVASSDGKVYVANDQTISVINVDPTSGGFDHAVANINTGTTNRDADITADGAILVVTGDNGLNIIKISETSLGFDYGVYNVNPGTPTRDASIPTDAGTAIVTTMAGNIFLVDIVPGSENFGTAYANTNPPAKAGDGKTSYDGLYYWVTNPYDDQVTVYELFYGGGISGSDPSSPSGLNLKEYTTIKIEGHRPEGICIENDNDKVLTINSGEEIGNGSVDRIANRTIETKTITDLVKDLAIALQTMIKENAIQQALGNMLIVKVNDASKNITLKKTKTAINMLNAFIDKVNELDAAGKISNEYPHQYPEAVDYLIETTKEIICMLQSKDPKTCVLSASIKSGTKESMIDKPAIDLISKSKLGTIYPNPFSESITIDYQIAECSGNTEKVRISIYDVSGRLIGTIVDRDMEAGYYSAVWTGRYNSGSLAPYGTYFIRFRAGNTEQVKQIMLVR